MITMQELEKRHFDYLEKELGVDRDTLFALVDANNNELEDLVTDLALREVDSVLAQDLIDAICFEFE